MNIDARVAERKHSDISDKHITLLLNLRYGYESFILFYLAQVYKCNNLVKMHEHLKYYSSHCEIVK